MGGMRLRAVQRRQLEELLDVAGDVETAVALPWVRHWRAIGAEEPLRFLAQSGEKAAQAVGLADRAAGDEPFADCRHAYLLEELLAVTQSSDRRQRGVYFTPLEIVQYIVRAVDQELREQLKLPLGLASEEVRILDPAAGSGVFLAEVIRYLGVRPGPRKPLPKLTGWEVLPAGVVAAHCLLAETLRETGFDFRERPSVEIELRDALTPPDERRFNVVLGNPPYASLSTARHGWIEELIRSPADGYMTVDGEPLGETKHWLHDDYVKFLRLAQWHIEQSGSGVVGMVTNHGYLENASFRGMRASLLRTFPHIQVVDLHGNAKMRERSPDGSRDENVFGIASGAAIGIFTRSIETQRTAQVRRADLWGARANKLTRLSRGSLESTTFSPTGPRYRFSAPQRSAGDEYDRGWRLCDAMPLNTTAPVTARDHFVVAFTHQELVERVEAFRNLSIPDGVLRERYFTRTRSSKYAPGDSRRWKLPVARRKLADDDAWRDRIRVCQYRPLDYRHVLWHDALIDWPRREVLRHLLDHENVALIARRQSPAGLPANFFWATQTLALDGIIRSDNRGSESLFPLWRYADRGSPHANFFPEFVADFERKLGMPFEDRYEALSSARPGSFTPTTLAGYIYGLFWSTDYRTSYQRELASDFPRIVPPRDAASFFKVSRSGLHLLRFHTQMPHEMASDALPTDWRIASGYPRFQDGQVWINPDTAIAPASAGAWELCIGAHQVARKWLLDRRGRRLSPAEIAEYRSVLAVLTSTTKTKDAS